MNTYYEVVTGQSTMIFNTFSKANEWFKTAAPNHKKKTLQEVTINKKSNNKKVYKIAKSTKYGKRVKYYDKRFAEINLFEKHLTCFECNKQTMKHYEHKYDPFNYHFRCKNCDATQVIYIPK